MKSEYVDIVNELELLFMSESNKLSERVDALITILQTTDFDDKLSKRTNEAAIEELKSIQKFYYFNLARYT